MESTNEAKKLIHKKKVFSFRALVSDKSTKLHSAIVDIYMCKCKWSKKKKKKNYF